VKFLGICSNIRLKEIMVNDSELPVLMAEKLFEPNIPSKIKSALV